QAGYHVYMYDIKQDALEEGIQLIDKLLTRSVTKERITEEEKAATLDRLTSTTEIADAKHVDFVIEAVVENSEVKRQIFTQLDSLTPQHAILASNTSSLPITELAAVTDRPEKVIGMHFMNPVPVMKLVEIIRALQT